MTSLFTIKGSSPSDLRHEAEGLDDSLASIIWALNRGHLGTNPTIHVAIQQIQIRMRLLHKLALEMEKPISGVMS